MTDLSGPPTSSAVFPLTDLATSSPTEPGRAANPYVGPRPFRQRELFFGRERESSAVVNSLLSSRVMLLHSPSGAGKTSLIQTTVVPAFVKRDFVVCATAEPEFTALRVNLPPPPELAVANRYVFSVVNGLIGDRIDRARAACMTLPEAMDEYLAPWGDAGRQLLIIDQLEEALTLDPADIDGQKGFFRQLGEALDDSRRWGLLAIREDYMGGLDRFRQYLPGQLRATFRLDFLDVPAARKAVQEPARACGVRVHDDAADLLVDELRKVHSGSSLAADETPSKPYPYVEPVLLQVVCYSLFDKLSKAQPGAFSEITEADVVAFRPFSKSIRKYYRTVVRDVARRGLDGTLAAEKHDRGAQRAAEQRAERTLRDWIEHHLISKRGLRRPTRLKPELPDADAVLGELRSRYLIRDDPRPGGPPLWELSHDMLVRPIREDNRAWRTKNLASWQVAAEDWRASDHDKRYLVGGKEYLEARRRNGLTETDEAYLAACQEVYTNQGRLTRLRGQLLALRAGLGLCVIAIVVLIVLYVLK